MIAPFPRVFDVARSRLHRLKHGICAAFFVLSLPTVAQADRCHGLEQFSQLAFQAVSMTSNPDRSLGRDNLDLMLNLTRTAETETLERRLTSKFRSLDYSEAANTVLKLRRMVDIGMLYGPAPARRYITEVKLRKRAAELQYTIDDMCGETRKGVRNAIADVQPATLANQITQAFSKQKPTASSNENATKAGRTSTGALVWLYSALALLLAAAGMAPRVVSYVYSMLLRRAHCKIPAILKTSFGDFEGKVTLLSLRGLTMELTSKDIQDFLAKAQVGLRSKVEMGSGSVALKLKYLPRDGSSSVGMRMIDDLVPDQLRGFLALSSIPPVRASRR